MSADGDRASPADHVDRMMRAWSRAAPGVDAEPLEVAGRILRCAAYLDRAIGEALRPLGLSFGDFDVINTLRRAAEPAGVNPRVLASSALITSGAMTSRLDRLERAGLVERGPDPVDRRAILVRLTANGERLAVRALDAVIDADRRFLEPLGADDSANIAAGLRRVLLRAEGSAP